MVKVFIVDFGETRGSISRKFRFLTSCVFLCESVSSFLCCLSRLAALCSGRRVLMQLSHFPSEVRGSLPDSEDVFSA